MAGLVAVWLVGRGAGRSDTAPPLATVGRGDVIEAVLASGQIEASQLVSVGARVSGQIETLPITLGQTLKQGDLIAQMDSLDQQNEVKQAEADLANIAAQIAAKKATLIRARQVQSRQQKLGSNNFSSQETVESATADVDVALADLDALAAQKARAEVSLSTARIALERTRITAPSGGTVVAVVVEAGQTVNAIQSAPTLIKLANLDKVLIKAEISEADVVRVRPGQPVSFTILGRPEQQFGATLRDIEPAPSEIKTSDTISTDSAIYYNGLMEVDNPDHLLRIGMTTQITIELNAARDVLRVPASAVQLGPDGPQVMLWAPLTGTSAARKVETGLTDKVWVEIRAGLAQGDQIVSGVAAMPVAGGAGGGRRRPPMGM